MAFSGAEFTFQQRQRVVRDLERYRARGVVVAKQILDLLTLENFNEMWPYVAPLYEQMLNGQQQLGRAAQMAYMSAVLVGVGGPLSTLVAPDRSLRRNGRLPSGMPISRLISTAELAIAHRVANGMSAQQALDLTRGVLLKAMNEALHEEFRNTAADILHASDQEIDWVRADQEYAERVSKARERVRLREERRMRENMSAKQKNALGWNSDGTGQYRLYPTMQRYIRVPSPGACSFCLMLASKGAIYFKDSFTHERSKGPRAFKQNGDATAHSNCRCTLYPEPAPGAWKNTIIGDPREYEAAVWTDVRYKEKYELARWIEGKDVLSVGDVERLRYVLAA